MASHRLQCLVLLAATLLLVQASFASPTKKVLALLQTTKDADQYSQLFDGLMQHGFAVEAKQYKDSSLKLRDYDTWLYDHLMVLAPKAESFGGSIDVQTIVDFIDSGRNVLLAASSELSDTIRSLAAEVGVDLDERNTKVYDHFNYASLGGSADQTLIATSDVVKSHAILGSGVKAPILFRGVAASVPADAELVTVALSAPITAYSHDPRKSMPEPPALMAGNSMALVSLVQARNNARVMVCGSIELLSNALFDAEVVLGATGKSLGKSGNRQFAVEALRWTFQDRGVLVAENMRHYHAAAPGIVPSLYRVNDDVVFEVDVFEVEGGVRKPYKADDIQVEFVMLDPYVRLPLEPSANGTFSLHFKVPDVYGVFKYVVEYRHLGYSYIQITQQVPVRPFKHNEYERFLTCAYPYYASALSTMAAFFLLGFFFLYHK